MNQDQSSQPQSEADKILQDMEESKKRIREKCNKAINRIMSL